MPWSAIVALGRYSFNALNKVPEREREGGEEGERGEREEEREEKREREEKERERRERRERGERGERGEREEREERGERIEQRGESALDYTAMLLKNPTKISPHNLSTQSPPQSTSFNLLQPPYRCRRGPWLRSTIVDRERKRAPICRWGRKRKRKRKRKVGHAWGRDRALGDCPNIFGRQ